MGVFSNSLVRQGLKNSMVRQGLNDSLVKQGLDNSLVKQGLDNSMVKQGLNDSLVKQGLNDSLVKQGLGDSLVKNIGGMLGAGVDSGAARLDFDSSEPRRDSPGAMVRAALSDSAVQEGIRSRLASIGKNNGRSFLDRLKEWRGR